ncbi:MAG TPA: YchF-related putative GTPase [Candidatus Thalassarchaeaceae archaeon]|nr:YchF-related putative GTPase [Candidatus Thalassarchaeaceae archaeon]
MRIGLVGKPNVGKSTTFSALTQTPVDIANYPFTTIDPNVGVAWIPLRQDCACATLRDKKESDGRLESVSADDPRNGSICNPNTGSCVSHNRLVPVTMIDVAGLVPGAHEGRGRGNQFLSDLARCDALIQVVDVSGSTDIEGNPVGSGGSNPVEEHEFLLGELDAWIRGIIESSWQRGARRVQSEGEKALVTYLLDQLSGIGASELHVSAGLSSVSSNHPDAGVPWNWGKEELTTLSQEIRAALFPICVAANKADRAADGVWDELQTMVEVSGGILVPTSAEAELALSRASAAGLIDFRVGQSSFTISEAGESKLSGAQREALSKIADTIEKWSGGGLIGLVGDIVFEQLNRRVAYPVQDETHWVDGDGNILPDAILIPEGTTAKGLAYAVHTDLGDGFIRATDARSGRVIGADHEVQNGDIIRIHAKT